MSVFNLDLIGDLAIVKGETYDKLDFYYKEDVSSWRPFMQIRNNYHNQYNTVGQSIATFLFRPLVYGSYTVNGETITATKISPYLTWSSTRTIMLPPSPIKQGKLIPFTNVWLYELDIFHSITNVKIKLCRGNVEIIPEIAAS